MARACAVRWVSVSTRICLSRVFLVSSKDNRHAAEVSFCVFFLQTLLRVYFVLRATGLTRPLLSLNKRESFIELLPEEGQAHGASYLDTSVGDMRNTPTFLMKNSYVVGNVERDSSSFQSFLRVVSTRLYGGPCLHA